MYQAIRIGSAALLGFVLGTPGCGESIDSAPGLQGGTGNVLDDGGPTEDSAEKSDRAGDGAAAPPNRVPSPPSEPDAGGTAEAPVADAAVAVPAPDAPDDASGVGSGTAACDAPCSTTTTPDGVVFRAARYQTVGAEDYVMITRADPSNDTCTALTVIFTQGVSVAQTWTAPIRKGAADCCPLDVVHERAACMDLSCAWEPSASATGSVACREGSFPCVLDLDYSSSYNYFDPPNTSTISWFAVDGWDTRCEAQP